MNKFGNLYDLVKLILGVTGLVFSIIRLIKKIPKRLTFYYQGINPIDTDLLSHGLKLPNTHPLAYLDPKIKFATLNLFIQNTGNNDIRKEIFIEDIGFQYCGSIFCPVEYFSF